MSIYVMPHKQNFFNSRIFLIPKNCVSNSPYKSFRVFIKHPLYQLRHSQWKICYKYLRIGTKYQSMDYFHIFLIDFPKSYNRKSIMMHRVLGRPFSEIVRGGPHFYVSPIDKFNSDGRSRSDRRHYICILQSETFTIDCKSSRAV